MTSASRLTYHLQVGPLDPAHGGGRLALLRGLAGCTNDDQSPKEVLAKRQDAIDAWFEASNDLGGPGHAIPAPARRLVLDAAQ